MAVISSRMVKIIIFGMTVFLILNNTNLSDSSEILKLSSFIVAVFVVAEIISNKQRIRRIS